MIGFVLASGLIWHVVWALRIASPAILPSPVEVLLAFPSFLAPNRFLPDVVSTVSRSMIAFVASVPIGLLSGFVVFNAGLFRSTGEFGVDFVRSIPATALVPVFLVIFGVGDSTKVAIGIFSSSLVICLSTIGGLNARNCTRLHIATLLGIRSLRRLIYVDLPESSSQLFVGLRAGVSLSLILVIVSEMFIGSNHGLGKAINDMRYSDQTPKLYCAMLMAGVIGYTYNVMLMVLENKLLHWRGR